MVASAFLAAQVIAPAAHMTVLADETTGLAGETTFPRVRTTILAAHMTVLDDEVTVLA